MICDRNQSRSDDVNRGKNLFKNTFIHDLFLVLPGEVVLIPAVESSQNPYYLRSRTNSIESSKYESSEFERTGTTTSL